MTAARLSPAASLLRNSKLFALPPAIALPTPEPSSEPVPGSDTATTLYPTKAAIETPLTSLGRGDWGFKRPLPLKSTTRTGSPSVRLNKGIDTREHIADFDSAADHVLTLKKFQELNQSIQHPRPFSDRSVVHAGVFRKDFDNTTNSSGSAPALSQYTGVWPSLSPADIQTQLPAELRSQEQEPATSQNASETQSSSPSGVSVAAQPRRWRYDGPSLVQMSGLEFDQYIKTLDSSKQQAFRDFVKQDIFVKKRKAHAATAQDEGTVGEVDVSTVQVSDQEVTEHYRKLRQQPREFGRLIATFLDLPEGPSGQRIVDDVTKVWDYGRQTLASKSYEDSGPPRTHPSAGLSYAHTARWVQNHAVFGPQDQRLPVVARQIKTRARGARNDATYGVAGFVVERENSRGIREVEVSAFEPREGGLKAAVSLVKAEVDAKGGLKMSVKMASEYVVEREQAVHYSTVQTQSVPASRPNGASRVMQPLTRNGAAPVQYRRRDDLEADDADEAEDDLDILDHSTER